MSFTIWHNPRCTKSRQTLALLEEKGITPTVREYLTDSPSEKEVESVLKKLGVAPRDAMRTKEAIYKELGLKEETSDKKLIHAMVKNPILIERPIVISGNKAVLGRPPENIKDLL